MLDGFVRRGNRQEWECLNALKSRLLRCQRRVQVAGCCKLRLGREVVAAQEYYPDVLEHERPKRHRRVLLHPRISCDRAVLREDCRIGRDVRVERDLDDVIAPPRGERADAADNFLDRERRPFGSLRAPGSRCFRLVFARTHRSDDVSAGPSGQLDVTEANRTRTTLDQHDAARDRARDVDTAMGSDARDAEAGPLLVGDPVG